MKKALSLLLSLLMLASLLAMPVSAGADDGFNDGQFGEWGEGDQPDTPDVPEEPVQGTKENPYPVAKPSSFPTQVEVKAGTSVYYQFPALKFNGWTLTGFALTGIEVNGVMNTELSLIDRAIKITLSNDGDLVGFYNDSEEDVTAILTLEEPLGTSDSPYRLEAGETAITIPEIHYEYYAEYTTEVVGEYTFDVSDYANFEVYFDANRYDAENELTQLTEALTLQLEAGTPVAFILRPVGGIFDVTLFVTAPAKGTEQNPYYLSSYDQVKAGVNELGDAMWPANLNGVYYTLDGYTFNGATLVVTGKGSLTVTVNGESWTKMGDDVTIEVPLELSEDDWSFSVIIKSAADVKVDVVFPEGTYENPLEMNKGKNTLSLDDMGNPYYATYTAEKDGVLVLKPNTVNGLGYTDVSNLTSGDLENGYDYIYIDPEGVNSSPDNVLKIQVSKGDVVLVSACACENDDFEILAMDLVLTLSYEGDVTIVKEPSTGYAKMGDKVTVKITAEGEGLTYTWHIKNAGSSKYSKSSVTKASYSVTMTDKVKDRLVFCRVYDADGNMVHQSKTVRLREAVSLTKQPATANYAKKGATVKVTIKASGDGLKYAWYVKNDGATKYSKSSITSATYSVTMSSKVKGRRVYCIVTDKYGKTVQSKTFILREGVSVTSVPATSHYAKNGATVKVSIKASGDGLKYTWYIKNANGTKYSKSSITSATYSAKMSSSVNGRRIYCVVTDKYGNVVQTKTMILKKK